MLFSWFETVLSVPRTGEGTAGEPLLSLGVPFKLGLCLGLLVALGLTAAPAHASYPDYWGYTNGVVVRETLDDSRDSATDISFEPPCCRSWQAGLTLGFQTEGSWLTRWDVDLSFQSVDVNQFTLAEGVSTVDTVTGFGDWETVILSVNGYHDFDDDGFLDPYVGAGLGYSYLRVEGNGEGFVDDTRDQDLAPAWQTMLGVRNDLTDGVTWLLEYRYTGTATYELTDKAGERYRTGGLRDHQAITGIQVNF